MKNKKCKLLTSLPSIIILVFSMLAIYSAAKLISMRKDLSFAYEASNPNKDMSMLWEKFEIQEMWVYWSVYAVGFCGFMLIVLNSSKLKKLEILNNEKIETLGLLENRLAALEAARDGIFIMDKDDNITYMNKSFCNIIGVDETKREQLIGKSWSSIFSRSDTEIIEDDILPELYEDGFWVGNFNIYREDNSSLHTEMSITQLPDKGLIGTVQDISYKKKSEQEKRDLEDQFYQAQKMEAIGRLAGGIAHDFNNILAAMNGYAEFLVDDLDENAEQKKFAENILQAGMQARELVDQMLAFSRRSDSAKNTLDIVSSVKDTLSMAGVTFPKTIDLKSNINVDHAIINGNQTQISQLIMNLCVNAQDAIEGDHGTVSVDMDLVTSDCVDIENIARSELPDPKETPYLRIDDLDAGKSRLILGHICRNNKYVKLSISDTGTGMSRVIMEHIFEPFFTTKPVDKGTGLGLSTVHGVLVSHQGLLVIESTLGKGTIFNLYFPVTGETAASRMESKIDSTSNMSDDFNGHILLIEDQDNVRDMVLKMLERMGYKTSYAVSGIDGLDLIRENPTKFDLVITDYNMPIMTGLEMINQLYEDLPDLPFIVLSGYSAERMQEIIDDHPAIVAVLRKPVSKDILSNCIKGSIRQKVEA